MRTDDDPTATTTDARDRQASYTQSDIDGT
jgi:hypothetical protein